MKVGKNQSTRPSGIVASNDGKFFYWACTISGIKTFANAERFVKVVANYGTEEKLFKEFVAAPVKKYLADGWDIAAIKELVKSNGGSLPKLGGAKKVIEKVKKVKKVRLKDFAVGKVDITVTAPTGSVETVKANVYPWSGNPDYFKSVPGVLSIEKETEQSCVYPNRNLDDQCHGCPIYDQCVNPAKYSKEAMKKPKPTYKVTTIKSFGE